MTPFTPAYVWIIAAGLIVLYDDRKLSSPFIEIYIFINSAQSITSLNNERFFFFFSFEEQFIRFSFCCCLDSTKNISTRVKHAKMKNDTWKFQDRCDSGHRKYRMKIGHTFSQLEKKWETHKRTCTIDIECSFTGVWQQVVIVHVFGQKILLQYLEQSPILQWPS